MNDASSRSPQKHRRKPWLPYAGGFLLLCLIVAGLWPKPPPVETAPVTTGLLRATINEEGKTRIQRRFVVSAPVTGQLRRIPFKAGAAIDSTNTVIAIIDPLPPALLDERTRALSEARRDTALAQLQRAQASLSFATSEFKRVKQLHDAKTVSVQELEAAEWRETASARELAAAESTLRQAEAEIAEFREGATTPKNPVEVRAPTPGRILRLFEESSRVVVAGTPLVEVGDPADLEVIIEVLSRDGAMIKPGTPVELEHWGGGTPLKAKIRYVEPAAFTKVSALGVEEQRVNAVADLLTPASERGNLGDQFRVEARIIHWEDPNALKIASGCLFRQGQAWKAYVLTNGRVQLRDVTVGRAGATETQILGGLREGEEAILYPGDRITDGQRVQKVKI